VAAFHRRPLKDIYRVLALDGVVLRRKTGAGALARPVLVALGLRPDGKKEVIDFRLASAESAAQWEQFLGDLVRRGLTGERLDMLCVDGGAGLLAAFHRLPQHPRPTLLGGAVEKVGAAWSSSSRCCGWRRGRIEMLGRKERRQPELFVAGTLRDLLPDDHVLVRVDRVLDLGWLREEVADCYCLDNGRPGIDAEVAIRLMLAGLLTGVVHDRKLVREARINLAIRWFIGYGLHERLPDHSSLTRIRQRSAGQCRRTQRAIRARRQEAPPGELGRTDAPTERSPGEGQTMPSGRDAAAKLDFLACSQARDPLLCRGRTRVESRPRPANAD
jgi:transposase